MRVSLLVVSALAVALLLCDTVKQASASATAKNFWTHSNCTNKICTKEENCPSSERDGTCPNGVCCNSMEKLTGDCREDFHNVCQDDCGKGPVMKNGFCPESKQCCVLIF